MSAWTHNICLDCWRKQGFERKPVVPAVEALTATCCWCGRANRDAIYQRADPEETPCKGKHDGGGPADS